MRIDGIRRLTYPGTFLHQITWQRSAATRSATGDDVATWEDYATVKASVASLSGRELENAQRTWAEARYIVQQHYLAGITAEMRGVWWVDGTARTLEVLDVQDRDGTGRWMTLICREQK